MQGAGGAASPLLPQPPHHLCEQSSAHLTHIGSLVLHRAVRQPRVMAARVLRQHCGLPARLSRTRLPVCLSRALSCVRWPHEMDTCRWGRRGVAAAGLGKLLPSGDQAAALEGAGVA